MPETVPVDREHEIVTPYGSLYAQLQRPSCVFVHPARLEMIDLDGERHLSHEPSITVDGRDYFVKCWVSYIDGLWILGDRHSRYDSRPNPASRILVDADSKWRGSRIAGPFIARRERRVAELIAEPLIVAFREWAERAGDIFAAENKRQEIKNKESKLRTLQYELNRAQGFVDDLPNRHRDLDREAERYAALAAQLTLQIADLQSEIEAVSA